MEELYNILGVPTNATDQDIKNAYKKLIIKYHPDKNNDPKSKEQFIKIHTAYKILTENTKEEIQNSDIYELIKQYITKLSPEIHNLYDSIITLFYNNENELKEDINQLNITNIYNKIKSTFITKTHKYINNFDNNIDSLNNINEENINSNKKLNIISEFVTSFEDKYYDRYAKVIIKRSTRDDYVGLIPLSENIIIIDKEGEIENNSVGDIIINIKMINDTEFDIMDNDIIINKEISLYHYLYGGYIKFKFLNEDLSIKTKSFVNEIPLIKIDNKGFIINDNIISEDSDKTNHIERGDMYIKIKITNLANLKEVIQKIS